MSKFDEDLVSGSVARSVIKLAWPAVMLNLTNGLHGIVDHALVGWYVGPNANAGIGIAWTLFLVVVVFLSSLFHGMNVLIARYSGRQDPETLAQVTYHAFLASVFLLWFVMAPAGYFLTPYLIPIVNQDVHVQAQALPYLRILFTCGSPMFLVLLLTFAMQASGNPKTPFLLGVLSTVLNIIFSFILVAGFDMGVVGAAYATCLAPVASLIISLTLLFRRKLIIPPPSKFTLIPDLAVVKRIAQIGFPTGIQAVLLNIGGLVLLMFLAKLEHSAEATAAYAICYSQLFALVTWASWGLRNAASTIIGQNIGAGNAERGVEGVYVAARFGLAWSVLLGAIYFFFPGQLLAIFGAHDDPLVYEFGVTFMRYLAFSGVFLSASLAFTGGLIGAGDTKSPLLIAFVTQIVVLLGICFIALLLGVFSAQIVWVSIPISHFLRYALSHLVFRRRRWKHIKVEFERS